MYRVLTGGSILIGGVRPVWSAADGTAAGGCRDAAGIPGRPDRRRGRVIVRTTARTPYPRWRRPPHPWCQGDLGRPRRRTRRWSRRWCRGRIRRSGAETSLATIRSTPLAASLAAARSATSLGLGREARPGPGPSPATPAQLGEDVRAWARGRARGRRRPWAAWTSAAALGRKSATAAAMTTTSAPAGVASMAAPSRRPSPPGRRPRRRRPARCGGGHQHHVGAAPAAASASAWPCLPDDRLEMKRTGSMGSRVPPADTTTRTPARSAPPRRSPGPPPGPAQQAEHRGHDGRRLGQPARHRRPRRPADPPRAAPPVTPRAAEDRQVLLDGRVLPHLGVHGRAHHHRGPRWRAAWR